MAIICVFLGRSDGLVDNMLHNAQYAEIVAHVQGMDV